MTISVSIHTESNDWKIGFEYPENQYSLTLVHQDKTGVSINFFLTREQWWAMRKLFPKASSYMLSRNGLDTIYDGRAADLWCEGYNDSELKAYVSACNARAMMNVAVRNPDNFGPFD